MSLDTLEVLMAASLVLLLGRQILARVRILRTYSIPEPVVGGLLVSLLVFALNRALQIDVRFDTTLQAPLMLTFFATIGLNADLAGLKAGGRALMAFLGVVVGLLVMQDALGIGLAWALGQERLLGLLGASVTLSGGHGTGAAWAKVFAERHGLASATEIAIACATFGLILGGLIGGPVARFLITRYQLAPNLETEVATSTGFEEPNTVRPITAEAVIETVALIAVCLAVGSAFASLLNGTAFELPAFVCVLFVGVVLRNGLAVRGWYRVFEDAVSVLGNVSLGLFLAIALMSLRLGDLASLALPLFVILVVQAIAMAAYAIFVTFRVMGRNYDAAVLAAGHCGFGLGATPTAIANMQAITGQFGPSHLAFLVVPMVGAFFIDIANAIVIKLFLLLPLYD
ncbi:sodium/glutamate symporter [Paraburkholderia hospita]|uniref:Sodium/glutamate symporter n=3 Tax=Paraburkholderia hospita TaxID=169430 RepID=A0AAJ4VW40_9BURK|nr:sodium/glutamate symporter [Paraburkholderia hospita]SKC92047.1 glutamate:Na+ symporter, ESS family [Burkholderia sp. CF099]SOE86619.1 glutamate:Na+ symporter, ESS family [Burkholderia sp. YR290]AUT71897.1 sodium/glutamate symporter [Paraburkholderia hospita]AXF02843.1 sodium/glutamate symporter [Paraburkholderia hospita]OUL71044.1 sodium/glutamate symporter [Paraburkholderia hospita]